MALSGYFYKKQIHLNSKHKIIGFEKMRVHGSWGFQRHSFCFYGTTEKLVLLETVTRNFIKLKFFHSERINLIFSRQGSEPV